MVRDVLNNCRDDWYHGRVIGIVETKNEAEAVWVVYKRKKNGEKYYVQSAKVNGIIMPLDEDVWTIMTVGQMALSVMKDIRTGTC